jgi:cytochrome c556
VTVYGAKSMQGRSIMKAGLCVVLALLLVDVAFATELDVEQVIENRQGNLRDMGAAFKAISDELKKNKPNILEVARYASSLQDLASTQKQWFPAGSGAESGVKTAAKAEIWSQPAVFLKWEDDLAAAIALLVKAAKAQDLDGVRQQDEQVGKACAGCHKTFRIKED